MHLPVLLAPAGGVPKWLKAELTVCYFVIVVFCLFCRRTAESVFIWNPLVSIADLKEPEMLFQSVLNFGLFLAPGLVFFQKNTGEKGPSLGGWDLPGVRTIAVAPAPGLF